jgi:hypothetical protein
VWDRQLSCRECAKNLLLALHLLTQQLSRDLEPHWRINCPRLGTSQDRVVWAGWTGLGEYASIGVDL